MFGYPHTDKKNERMFSTFQILTPQQYYSAPDRNGQNSKQNNKPIHQHFSPKSQKEPWFLPERLNTAK